MRELLKDNKICAILRNVPLDKTLSYARAVYDGGVRMYEVAMNSADAARQIALLRDNLGKDALIGAGTVITLERCKAAQAAGAQFFLTPSTTECTLKFCADQNIPLLPGILSPTDVAVCLEYGFSVMKLFPAGDMPAGYIKSLKGPFDNTDYVAVGGVDLSNIRSFFERGFIGVGIGGNLIPKEYVSSGRWEEARDAVRKIVDAAKL